MKSCPEGAYTLGHLLMAGLTGAVVLLVIVMLMRDWGMLRDPPPEG